MEYLAIELILFAFTFLIHRAYKVRIFRTRKKLLHFWAYALVLGVLWDSYAVYRGHWVYSEHALIGINIGLIPVEDYIFIFLVAYAILVLYHACGRHNVRKPF